MMLWLLLGLAGVCAQNPITIQQGMYCTQWVTGFTKTGWLSYPPLNTYGVVLNANLYYECYDNADGEDQVCAGESRAICPWARGPGCYSTVVEGRNLQDLKCVSDTHYSTCVAGCITAATCTNAPQFASYTGTDSSCPWVCSSGFYQSGSSCTSSASLVVPGSCSAETSCYQESLVLYWWGQAGAAIQCSGNSMTAPGSNFPYGVCHVNDITADAPQPDPPRGYIQTISPYSNTLAALVSVNISVLDSDIDFVNYDYVILLSASVGASSFFQLGSCGDSYATGNFCQYFKSTPGCLTQYITACTSVTINNIVYDRLVLSLTIPGSSFYQDVTTPQSAAANEPTDPNTWFSMSYSWQVACAQCPSGEYQAGCQGGNVGTCTSCAMGTYSNFSGATVCSPCPSATYSNYTGATACASCQPCSPGYYTQAVCGGSSPGNCTKCTN